MAEEKKEAAPQKGAPGEKEKKKNGRTPSAKKRHTQSLKARLRNRGFKATVTTAMRSFEEAVAKGDKTVMKEKLNSLYSLLDKGVKTGRFKLNKAARTKSRLTSKIA
ncbi:MAG: 30S ribosomal protein S20 [Thermodesulfobacteriota bacterium]